MLFELTHIYNRPGFGFSKTAIYMCLPFVNMKEPNNNKTLYPLVLKWLVLERLIEK